MRTFIETHFGLVLVLACIAGLFLPGLPALPNESAIVVLAMLMFVSCYRLRDGGIRTIRWQDIAVFWLLRYALLPVMLWLLAYAFAPRYATSVFLLSVLPAAVSSPAFASIYQGAVPIAFAIAIASQLATLLLIPLQFAWLPDTQAIPAPGTLFTTMIWCVFLPLMLYAATRHHVRSAAVIYRHGKLWSVLLIAFIIALVVAKQRDVILGNVAGLAEPMAVSLLCFACYIVFGWSVMHHRPREERIAYATCSGFNNAALGVSLALLHFPPETVLFVAVSEMVWALLPAMFKTWLNIAGEADRPQ